ncbi:hypothetical protein B5E80_15275 [Flavonifractor sp. An135]|nr:LIM domain-containing protein [Flavonifractor sp. An135]OUQ22158.1 hypothetical protein B5E80_15275 [Flavonifractor sp. An135]
MSFDENLTSPPYYPVKLVEDEHMTQEFKDSLYRMMSESTVQAAKNTDKLLFGAVKQILTEHGIHNTYVLNEDFIVEAIREKMERNSATKSPIEKSGKWLDAGWDGDSSWQIDGRGHCWHVFRCSECGAQLCGSPKTPYCHMCGARMDGE